MRDISTCFQLETGAVPPGGGSGPCLRHENTINPNKFVIFCDLLCSNMIICQKSNWIYQNSVRKHEIRPENMMIHPMWTMFVHHEKVWRSITKSPYVNNLTKLLANSSLLINLHGDSGSSHAYIQVCAFKKCEWCRYHFCCLFLVSCGSARNPACVLWNR